MRVGITGTNPSPISSNDGSLFTEIINQARNNALHV
jgi:hypothetical protein